MDTVGTSRSLRELCAGPRSEGAEPLRFGGMHPRERAVTHEAADLEAVAALSGLTLEQRGTLCRLLLIEAGFAEVSVHVRAESVDLDTRARPLWRERPLRVRLLGRPVTDEDVEDLAGVVHADGLADGVLVETTAEGARPGDERVAVVSCADFVARLKASALITWSGGEPSAAPDRYASWVDLSRTAGAHDPIGLRWLPTLALNRVPEELLGMGTSAYQLLERIAFRVLSTVFRFGGYRLGETAKGERLPDALLLWDDADAGRRAAFLDCKATGTAYSMSSGDERAQTEYVERQSQLAEEQGADLGHVVILSSDFVGDFELRRTALEKVGVSLCYLRAVDLVRLALAVEIEEDPPAVREAIPWDRIFREGQPTAETLEAALEEARAAVGGGDDEGQSGPEAAT
jgi:hypothetical protein